MKNSREQRVLALLREDVYTPARSLAAQMGLSEKTIQTLIKNINDDSFLYGARIEAKRRHGYRLAVIEPETYENSKRFAAGFSKENLPQLPKQRPYYIVFVLLTEKHFVKLDTLVEALFVSKSTLAVDMKSVREILGKFGIDLDSKPNYGMKVRCTELNRRRCLAWLMKQSEEIRNHDATAQSRRAMIGELVERTLCEEGFRVSEISKRSLTLHICIAIQQIEKGCSFCREAVRFPEVDAESRRIAYILGRRLQERFQLEIAEGEMDYIAMQLSCKQILEHGSTSQNLVLDQAVQDLADGMLLRIWEELGFDFRNDFELKMNLCLHLLPMRNRMAFGFPAENPLLEEIKLEYPLAYEIAALAVSVLAEEYWVKISEDETGFIAILFALALERRRSQIQKNILLVCGSGRGSAGLLKLKLAREFEGTIGTIRTCTLSQLPAVDFSEIDFVFTTVGIEQLIPVPIVEMSWFLRDDEVREIRQQFEKQERIAFAKYFCRELFFAGLKAETREDALRFLCGQAVSRGFCEEGFYDLVMAREELGRTTYSNGIAMPHPIRSTSRRTFIAVGVPEKPVNWDGVEVRLIFLISVSMTKSGRMDDFYKGITRLFTSRPLIERLAGAPCFETLERIIRELEGQ